MMELRRIINYKRIILLLLAATVNIVFFLYGNKPVKDADILYRENAAHTAYIEGYHDEVSAITDNAEKLKKYSIFNKAGSFSYANILQTAKDFERVKDVVLPDDEYKGVQAHTAYYYQYFFTMLVMMFVIYDMFAQRDNGMWSITYSCANGRKGIVCGKADRCSCSGRSFYTYFNILVYIYCSNASGRRL